MTDIGLNDSGEQGSTRIVRSGAIHHSRGQRTSHHSHYAWKIHVGVDAPVWLKGATCQIDTSAGARVVVAPPGVAHSTGATGWSCAIFIAPGKMSTPWRASSGAFALGGATATRIVEACRHYESNARDQTADFFAEAIRTASQAFVGPRGADSSSDVSPLMFGGRPKH